MQISMYQSTTSGVWADALFASMLQRSERPDAGQVRKAIAAAVRAYGGPGCAQRVAQEFGDHPETAVDRMRWARSVADEACGQVSGAPPRPAQDRNRRWPGLRPGGSGVLGLAGR